MKNLRRIAALTVTGLCLVACSKGELDVASSITDDVNDGAACKSFSGKLSATLGQALIDEKNLPTEDQLRGKLAEKIPAKTVERVIALYRVVVDETRENLGAAGKDDLLAAIMALEIGDETTPEKARLKGKIQTAYAAVKSAAIEEGLTCNEPDGETPPTPPSAHKSTPADGAVHVMTVAYQSCQARRLPAMTAATASVKGIVVTGTHSSGTGLKREVGDLKALQQSHYYIREGIENDSGCFDVTKKPLIYDYGGKPYATTATDSTIDLFRNAGSGTTVLGIDCSGYVFSALAASGLRVSPSKRLTASLVYGINAKMYMEPSSNGLSCLAPVVSTKDGALQDGDILASSGHVVMVDHVGADPFGIARLRSASDCVTANVDVRNFDFDVLQSSPVKSGIGIDRMRAADYLPDSSSMKTALVAYGVAACKARFGSPSTVKPSTARLVRHKMTAECMDRPVKLERESCVRSCAL